MIDPWREGQEALVVGLVGPHVGPLVEERAVEALTLAVRLRPERTGALVAGADIAERRAEGPRDGVVLGVVGHDPLDAHTLAGEPGGRLAQEARAGHPALIGEGGDVGDPAHVVDGVMEEVIAAPGTGRATAPTPEPMTAALGDPPELLDVDVEQLARSLLDVADRHARGAVLVAQPGRLWRRRTSPIVERGMPSTGARRCGPNRNSWRARRMASTLTCSSERGERIGRELRSSRPARPAWR